MANIILGSAQFGLDYGIDNPTGKIDSSEVMEIISIASKMGINFIDTARSYGDAEKVIGIIKDSMPALDMKIITKLSPSIDIDSDDISQDIESAVKKSIFTSMAFLNLNKIEVLMLHRAEHIDSYHGLIWNKLLQYKNLGLISKLGASVQSPEELSKCLKIKSIEYIQLPFNLLDWRWGEFIDEIFQQKKERFLQIHTRSSFLQGLITSRLEKSWMIGNVKNPEVIIRWLDKMLLENGCKSTAELALRYTLSQPWIDGVVIGVNSAKQLAMNFDAFNKGNFDQSQLNLIENTRPTVNINTLNPSKWHHA